LYPSDAVEEVTAKVELDLKQIGHDVQSGRVPELSEQGDSVLSISKDFCFGEAHPFIV